MKTTTPSCHQPGDNAPMPLLSHEQARPWAKSIREKVSLGQMPPRHAAEPIGTFANERRLTAAEKEVPIQWAIAGAPQGDPKDLPPQPKFTECWEIGKPDVVLGMAKPFEVPASGTINHQSFTIPSNFNEDKWVQAVEVRPGTRSVVHHVLVFCKEPDAQSRPSEVHWGEQTWQEMQYSGITYFVDSATPASSAKGVTGL